MEKRLDYEMFVLGEKLRSRKELKHITHSDMWDIIWTLYDLFIKSRHNFEHNSLEECIDAFLEYEMDYLDANLKPMEVGAWYEIIHQEDLDIHWLNRNEKVMYYASGDNGFGHFVVPRVHEAIGIKIYRVSKL